MFKGETIRAEQSDVLEQMKFRRERDILSDFSLTEQRIISDKQKRLSVLAQFIGKDFKMPVELNESGQGWHWDFKNNIVRIDPKDLLEKDFDYLRFVISHEGGHRRISRTDFIPDDVWQRPGFSFMMNAVEDPRDNNFVADSYPQFAEQMDFAYQEDLDLEQKSSERARELLGRQPRFMQAGFELIKQWYREIKNEPEAVSKDLPKEVRQAVAKILPAARDSWWTYPLKKDSESEIRRYAQASYKINLEQVWPEFAKLVELDLEDQKTQELLDELKQEKGERPKGDRQSGSGGGLPQELQDQLTPQEQEQLEQAIDEALSQEARESQEKEVEDGDGAESKGEKGKKDKETVSGKSGKAGESAETETKESSEGEGSGRAGKRVDMDKLPEKLKQKLKKYLESLSEEKKKELQDKAQQSLQDAEAEIGEAMKGKFEAAQDEASESDKDNETKEITETSAEESESKSETEAKENAEVEKKGGKEKAEKNSQKQAKQEKKEAKPKPEINPEEERERQRSLDQMRQQIEKVMAGDGGKYEKTRHEMLPLIKLLEDELRQVFTERAKNKLLTGFKSGRKIDIVKRIQEKAKGILTMDSKAWQRREAPGPRDYAFTLLIDLSGSMDKSGKIEETFKATIVLAEVLNRLGIRTEILGFNDRLHQYQNFGQYFDSSCRNKIDTMLKEVKSDRAQYNDDGWAVLSAAERLAQEREQEKFLLVFSDGVPEESPQHRGREFNLSAIINKLEQEKKIKLVGLGIGSGTGHVKEFYPNALADIPVDHLAENLALVIKEAVANYDQFR